MTGEIIAAAAIGSAMILLVYLVFKQWPDEPGDPGEGSSMGE